MGLAYVHVNSPVIPECPLHTVSRLLAIHNHVHPPCKGIQDSLGFWIPLRGFRISRWWISVFVGGTWILDCNCRWDSRFLELYSGFQSPGFGIPQANFPRFWIPQAKLSWIPESGFRHIGQPLACSRRSDHVECGPRSESGK